MSAVEKNYDGDSVLRDCSYVFEKTGVYAIMGPNGCGKSTFLRICALIEYPDRGEVSYFQNSEKVKHDISLKRRISLVLPGIGIFHTSVFKNVAYGLKLRRIQKDELRSRVDAALESVGLSHKRQQNALTLSSGEKQRLGLARVLAIEPDVIFLDEPTASIDVRNTEMVENIITKMRNDRRSLVVMATHDQAQAERLADRVLMITAGRVQIHNE
jgi:tungstate transport system ATP-binding protein